MASRFRPASRQLMRAINESIVLDLIRRTGPIPRVDISRTTRHSAATVTGITTALIERGLVSKTVPGVSTGGRRPILLTFNRRAGIVLGVKITEAELVCVTTDLEGYEERRRRITLPHAASPGDVVGLIAGAAEEARNACAPRRLFGVGVGIAGVVDRPSGVSQLSPFLRWERVPLQQLLADAIGVPVVVENDVNTLAFAYGSEIDSANTSTFIVVTIGRGVGLGMMLNNRPFRGGRGQGGEFGHITVDPDGPVCECGKRGCLEAVASVPAVCREASVIMDRHISEPELRELVQAGDERLAPLSERVAVPFGRALATLVNVLNPDAIVVSGEGAWLAGHLLPRIEAAMNADVFDGLSRELDLRVDARGDEFWAAGAAGLLLEETFGPRLERAQGGRG